ncbi:MAG: hypothetical protein CMC33_01045 [Flavobacteriaceae bacterium]|nr:hypothetical protein [Flavobacteriaceae bacterium]
MSNFNNFFDSSPFDYNIDEKDINLIKSLRKNLQYQYNNCLPFKRLLEKRKFNFSNDFSLEDIPYIPVTIFKDYKLKSVKEELIVRKLTSSATSSQNPSQIFIDKHTRVNQMKSLVWILSSFLGKNKMPYLIMDIDPNLKKGDFELSARGAAIRGFLVGASKSSFCMNEQLEIDYEKFYSLIKDYEKSNEKFVLFGYTYIMYLYVAMKMKEKGEKLNLSNCIVMHIGGWKKLYDQKVSKEDFNKILVDVFGVRKDNILDVYGFTEQLGTVYISKGNGMKEVPKISKVLVRDPYTLEVLKDNQEGLLQFLNPIPYSYPGLSVLTDDLGVKCTINNKEYFEITGRAKNSEVRGCGDILSESM